MMTFILFILTIQVWVFAHDKDKIKEKIRNGDISISDIDAKLTTLNDIKKKFKQIHSVPFNKTKQVKLVTEEREKLISDVKNEEQKLDKDISDISELKKLHDPIDLGYSEISKLSIFLTALMVVLVFIFPKIMLYISIFLLILLLILRIAFMRDDKKESDIIKDTKGQEYFITFLFACLLFLYEAKFPLYNKFINWYFVEQEAYFIHLEYIFYCVIINFCIQFFYMVNFAIFYKNKKKSFSNVDKKIILYNKNYENLNLRLIKVTKK